MGLRVFNRVSCRYLEGVALLVASGLLGGCSSDFTRFTDGIYTSSTSSQQAVVQPRISGYQAPASEGEAAYRTVESYTLPPVPAASSEGSINTAALGIGTPPPVTAVSSKASESASKPEHDVTENLDSQHQSKTYIVQSGDTLFGIARRNNVTVHALKQENSLDDDKIRIGQALALPVTEHAADTQTQIASAAIPIPLPAPVRPNHNAAKQAEPIKNEPPAQTKMVETVKVKSEEKIAQTPVLQPEKAVATASDVEQKAQSAAIVAPQASGISAAQMRWPARGRILSSFGQREGTTTNDGMDILVPEGTSIKAADSGVVIYAGDGLKEFGNTVLIRHEDNIVTVYGHNSKILVQRGQKVRRGDEIAKSGMSGNATTPRLHFEVRKNSAPVNPVKYLEN